MGSTQSTSSTDESCDGKSLIYLPGFIRNRIMWSIEEAERLKGSPGNTPEIVAVVHFNFTTKLTQCYIFAFLNNLYREDRIFAD